MHPGSNPPHPNNEFGKCYSMGWFVSFIFYTIQTMLTSGPNHCFHANSDTNETFAATGFQTLLGIEEESFLANQEVLQKMLKNYYYFI